MWNDGDRRFTKELGMLICVECFFRYPVCLCLPLEV